jgi:hypothetical protein
MFNDPDDMTPAAFQNVARLMWQQVQDADQ